MGVEIERKFLVLSDDWKPLVVESVSCKQGYVPVFGKRVIRVRLIGDRGFLTLKGPRQGIIRDEFEYEIPFDEAEQLLDTFCDLGPIEKTRHHLDFGGLGWEIDEFKGANEGLVLAEVELESEEQEIVLPPWVGKDVSKEERFFNACLAKHPIQDWSPKKQNGSTEVDPR